MTVRRRTTRSPSAKALVFLALVTMLLVGVAGCGNADSGDSGESGEIIIGMTAEETGPVSVLGTAAKGAKAAVQQLNADGGVDGRDVELVVRDNASDSAKAIQNVNEFNQLGAAGMVGPAFSQNCVAVAPELAKEDLPGICISPNDLPEETSHMFGVGVGISQQDEFTYDYLSQSADKIGVLAAGDESGTQAEANAEAAREQGIDIQIESADPADTTFKPQLQSMISDGVEALYLTSCGPISLTAAGEAVALRFKGQIALIDCFASLSAADAVKGFANGKVITFAPQFMLGTTPSDDPQSEQIDLYNERDGGPDIVEGAGWDGVMVLAQAIEDAGSTDPADIIAALEDDFEYAGVWSAGTITADDHRGATIDGALIPTVFTPDGELESLEEQ